ncbi:hypothetical protein HO133_000602 [Letharia lupina]|uniref:Uncharacterized protein n=1 Tax=Letharia lupina TaxID=560253 RepID=A0A8H6CFI9_9LECA|nr:uncharacterized protein HO133_000602 [Letharia lupina]KAF6222557.1 hypothetical protein HO133_000602 [Letharia lupina]
MSVLLPSNFSLATNASAYNGGLSVFPAPIAPDVVRCSSFFSGERLLDGDKCRSTWDLLPRGSNQSPWFTNPESSPAGKFQSQLPIKRGDEKCRIKVSASGKPTEEVNFAVYISGNTMRDMVGRIIEECVGAREESQQTPWGGVGTLSIRQTLDWIVQPGTRFPESLDIPTGTTFITAMVYSNERLTDYEPGAQSKVISRVLLDWIDAAAGRLPHGSPFWGVLANRFFYVWKANEDQESGQGGKGEFPHWWDDVQVPPNLERGRANGTKGAGGAVRSTLRDLRKTLL